MNSYTYSVKDLKRQRDKLQTKLDKTNFRSSSITTAKLKEDIAFVDNELKLKGVDVENW